MSETRQLQNGNFAQSGLWHRLKPAGELRRLQESIRRVRECRVLCPNGHGVQKVLDSFPNLTCSLECGCRRTVADLGCGEQLSREIWKLEREIEQEKKGNGDMTILEADVHLRAC